MAADLAPADIDLVIERALAALPEAVWRVVDTRRGGKLAPRADVVVVGPAGVFVILCSKPGAKERVRARLERTALDSAAAVADLAGVRRDEVHAVVCQVGEESVDAWRGGVIVCSAANLAETITFRRSLLTPAEVTDAARAIGRTMRGKRKHRA